MICITGSSGTLGSEVMAQLESTGTSLRAACFSAKSADAAQSRGIQTAMIDYDRPATLRAAFRGCDTLFLLGPNSLNQTEMELNAVAAAQEAGVRRIVKQSVMGAVAAAYSLATLHRPVEEAIEASGLDWTFLRPNSFMQNAVTFMAPTIRAESLFYSATDGAAISHVDVRDIAAVAVRALIDAGHEGRAYTLTGSEALSYDEVADVLSVALQRPIKHVNLAPSELKAGMLAEGMPEASADRLLDLERYLREGHASRVTTDIEQVTGRPPRWFADYARETAATGVWALSEEPLRT